MVAVRLVGLAPHAQLLRGWQVSQLTLDTLVGFWAEQISSSRGGREVKRVWGIWSGHELFVSGKQGQARLASQDQRRAEGSLLDTASQRGGNLVFWIFLDLCLVVSAGSACSACSAARYRRAVCSSVPSKSSNSDLSGCGVSYPTSTTVDHRRPTSANACQQKEKEKEWMTMNIDNQKMPDGQRVVLLGLLASALRWGPLLSSADIECAQYKSGLAGSAWICTLLLLLACVAPLLSHSLSIGH
jgi:hypothetical protein